MLSVNELITSYQFNPYAGHLLEGLVTRSTPSCRTQPQRSFRPRRFRPKVPGLRFDWAKFRRTASDVPQHKTNGEYRTDCFASLKWAIPGLFLFIFAFLIQFKVSKNCRWLDSNRGSLVSETNEPLLPFLSIYLWLLFITILFDLLSCCLLFVLLLYFLLFENNTVDWSTATTTDHILFVLIKLPMTTAWSNKQKLQRFHCCDCLLKSCQPIEELITGVE